MATLAYNSKAKYDYIIKDTFDAGLVLEGREVKACKDGNISLSGSFVVIHRGEAYLTNCHIGPYPYASNQDYNPTKNRKVLLKAGEINSLLGKEKGLVIVPLEIYVNSRGLVKLKIALARARKKTDKREYIKKRDTQKEIRKHLD